MSDDDSTAWGGRIGPAVRRCLRASHGGLVRDVGACADAVRTSGTATGDRPAGELEDALRSAGVLERAAAAIPSLVEAAGYALRADPVPAPPHVVVTSEGLLLRATVADGRLAVTLRAFEVVRAGEYGGTGPRYRRLPDVEVDVSFRRTR